MSRGEKSRGGGELDSKDKNEEEVEKPIPSRNGRSNLVSRFEPNMNVRYVEVRSLGLFSWKDAFKGPEV